MYCVVRCTVLEVTLLLKLLRKPDGHLHHSFSNDFLQLMGLWLRQPEAEQSNPNPSVVLSLALVPKSGLLVPSQLRYSEA